MSVNPISHAELWSWAQLTGTHPALWEVRAIRGIDSAFIASILEDQDKPKK